LEKIKHCPPIQAQAQCFTFVKEEYRGGGREEEGEGGEESGGQGSIKWRWLSLPRQLQCDEATGKGGRPRGRSSNEMISEVFSFV